MRINNDLRLAVAFIGFDGREHFDPVGTGFFVEYGGYIYLVTAKHVAVGIGDAPFDVRYNTNKNVPQGVELAHLDPVYGHRWYFHQDPSVDVAVYPVRAEMKNFAFISIETFSQRAGARNANSIDVGDTCYTIGLFRLMYGKKRNLPVVHAGTVSLLPSDEPIPVKDWDTVGQGGSKLVEGYLVEQQSLEGLSGSPVFVRPSIAFSLPGRESVQICSSRLLLLGMWQAAWDASPDALLARERGADIRVPVGMGVVVPSYKIEDVLASEELKLLRGEARQ